jgi:hypothetical protein
VALQGAAAVLVFDGHGPQSTSSLPIRGAAVEVCFAGGHLTRGHADARGASRSSPQTWMWSSCPPTRRCSGRHRAPG